MKLKSFLLSIMALAILASCSTTNDVVSGRSIQKRKYNDGYYISSGNKFKKSDKVTQEEELVSNPESTSVNQNFSEANTVEKTLPVFVREENPTVVISTEASHDALVENASAPKEVVDAEKATARPLNLTKSEEKVVFKPGRESRSQAIKTVVANAASVDAMTILLVILALFIPWLAVLIFEGATGRFWIDLLLWIIGIGIGYWLFGFGLAYLCALIAVIYAILIVLSVI